MSAPRIRLLLGGVLIMLLLPALSFAQCKTYVFHDVYPEGFFMCGDNTYPPHSDPEGSLQKKNRPNRNSYSPRLRYDGRSGHLERRGDY